MRGYPGPELVNQLRLHEFVLIGNMQRDDASPIHDLGISLAKTVQVGFFHHENNLRPTEQPFTCHNPGLRLGSAGAHLNARNIAENNFGR